MANTKTRIALLSLLVFLSSCTIAHYEIRDRLNDDSALSIYEPPCDIKYYLSVVSGRYTNTHGVKKDGDKRLIDLKSKYRKATETVLNEKGCTTVYVNNKEEADFIIDVNRLLSLSALPQEWFTGLSFGLIPSWGTRPSQFVYTFEDVQSMTKHSFVIDQKSYNHIILFPVFWVTFITADEMNIYQKSLLNFIENS